MDDTELEATFYGVFAPSWVSEEGFIEVLKAEAENAASDRDRALFLVAADRVSSVRGERERASQLTDALQAMVDDCVPAPNEGHIPNAPSERSYVAARAVLATREETT